MLVNHLRLHASLDFFEQSIGYTFKNRSLLQLAMTHPSYKENYGTNPDHCRYKIFYILYLSKNLSNIRQKKLSKNLSKKNSKKNRPIICKKKTFKKIREKY